MFKKFKTANDLKKYISKYKISVENSLWRLYSIRNKITHEAYIDNDLSLSLSLTQLDYFFKITYNNLLFASTLKSFNSRRNIFKIYNDKYLKIWGEKSKINMDKLDKEEFRYLILEPFSMHK